MTRLFDDTDEGMPLKFNESFIKQHIKIPEIDQTILDSIILDEKGDITNIDSIHINEDDIDELIRNYRLTSEEKEALTKEIDFDGDSGIKVLKTDADEIDENFENKKKEIEEEIQQKREDQNQVNTELRALFEEVKTAQNDLKEERGIRIQDIENENEELLNQIKDINEQLSVANEHLNELDEYKSIDTSTMGEQITSSQLQKHKDQFDKSIVSIFGMIDNLNSLFDQLSIEDHKINILNDDEDPDRTKTLNKIRNSTENAIDVLYQ